MTQMQTSKQPEIQLCSRLTMVNLPPSLSSLKNDLVVDKKSIDRFNFGLYIGLQESQRN